MNRRLTLLAAMLLCVQSTTAHAVDLANITRSIEKEPAYDTPQPGYCLMVFGEQARTRVWLVVDGRRLYVDLNGNGDLTEKGESFKSGGTGAYGQLKSSFKVKEVREAGEDIVHKSLSFAVSSQDELQIVIRQPARGGSQAASPRLGTTAKEAPIVHFNGPPTLGRPRPIWFVPRQPPTARESQLRWLRVSIGSPGLGQGTFAQYSWKGLLGHAVTSVTIDAEFSNRDPDGAPIKLHDRVDVRGGSAHSLFRCGPVRVPRNATGWAKITLSIPDWNGGKITPCTYQALIVGSHKDIPTVIAALQTEDLTVRKAISRMLDLNFKSVGEDVLRTLGQQLNDPDPKVRRNVIRCLTEWNREKIHASKRKQVFALLTQALEDPNAGIRAAAIRAMAGHIDKDRIAASKLISALSDDDPGVRSAAAYKMSDYTPHAAVAVAALTKLLDDPVHQVRAGAVASLGADGPQSLTTLPLILPLLNDREQAVRHATASAIAKIDRTAIGAIVEKLTHSKQHIDLEQKLTEAAFREMGARIRYKSGKVKRAAFWNAWHRSKITDIDLKLLRQLMDTEYLSDLTELDLTFSHISDDGLTHLKDLTRLTYLRIIDQYNSGIRKMQITDAGLRHLSDLTNLRSLRLANTKITDRGLIHLKKLKILRSCVWMKSVSRRLDWHTSRTCCSLNH